MDQLSVEELLEGKIERNISVFALRQTQLDPLVRHRIESYPLLMQSRYMSGLNDLRILKHG